MTITEYTLPDRDLFLERQGQGREVCVFRPDRTIVVLGNGSDPQKELAGDRIVRDGIPVMRRRTGGLSVVLSQNMACVSFAEYRGPFRRTGPYFLKSNSIIMQSLNRLGVSGLGIRGVSDIAIGVRKISGSSIYLNGRMILFHAVINLAEDAHLIDRYLLHPPREPDYRQGRPHPEFVTSLREQGHMIAFDDFSGVIREFWNREP